MTGRASSHVVFFDPDAMRAELDSAGRRLYEHWLALCPSEGEPPEKARMDPLDFPFALSGIALVDVRGARDDFRYRLVGTRDVQERGFEPTGKKVKDAYFARSAEVALDNYGQARRGEPFVAVEQFRGVRGVPVIDVVLFLPLTDGDGTVTTIMAYSYCRTEPPS
jgi:hypothetical protein